jgi:hypothetical protein
VVIPQRLRPKPLSRRGPRVRSDGHLTRNPQNLEPIETTRIMNCRLKARQCISATVRRNYRPPSVKLDASFDSNRPHCRACCHTRLSAHTVLDRRGALPAPANLLGLHGRGDRAAWPLGGGRNGHCQASPLPPLGHRRVRSGAKNLAKPRALVAPLDLCRAHP